MFIHLQGRALRFSLSVSPEFVLALAKLAGAAVGAAVMLSHG